MLIFTLELFLFICTFRLSVAFWKIYIFFFFRGNTKLERGNFILSDKMDQHEAVLEKFAFSNALCLSGENLNHINVCSFVVALYSASPMSVTSCFPFSEAGDMGGVVRQLCRLNSVNSRGTLET